MISLTESKPIDSKRIIVALDRPGLDNALSVCDQLDPALCRVKVGHELFTSGGPAAVAELRRRGFEVFLDLKYHDIPNTVANACKMAADLGVWMMNVHASGGKVMMELAREALGAPGADVPLLIAVTVLTSMEQSDLQSTGVNLGVDEQVLALTALTHDAGLDGVVCSAREAALITDRQPAMIKVTPGIRLATDYSNDQKRITTPEQAIANGASYLVIGRSITGSADPLQTLRSIASSLS
jgi:orotidine-5'-phosphate decarboxylase